MKPRALLLLLPVLLAGISVWLVQSAGDPTVPGRADAAPAVPGAAPTIATDATAVDATSHGSDAERSAAGAATDQRVPFPDDAFWVEVRVVDKATGEAVPEATVTWSDQTTQERLNNDASLNQEERRWLQRDQEQVNLRYGWQAISDRSGLVRVHVSENTLVLARQQTRYGTLRLQKNAIPPRDGYRVELEPDLEQAVQVVDARGQPAADVPIGVTQNDAQGKAVQLWRWQAQAITRAPDGIALLRHLQEARAEARAESTKVAEWRVRTFLPGYDDPGVAFSIEAPAREPIVLRLPPCGGVRVRAELHGAALSDVKAIQLAETGGAPEKGGSYNWMMRRASLQRPVDDQGWAHFDHVPLGSSYRASASIMSGYLSSEFKGPMTEETVVSVALTLAGEQILLAGRLLDEQKTVLADQECTLALRERYSENNTKFRTDNQGRFLLFLGPLTKDQPRLQRVCIVWRPPGSLLQADLSKYPFRAGLQDAGDIVLQPGQLVVAGRLMSGDGPCKAKVQPSVERYEVAEGKPEPRWRGQRDLQFQRDDDGHFEFRGDAEPGRYRLTCNSRNHLPVEPIEFALGSKDVVVNLDTGSPLAASVLVPKDFPGGLRALLVRDGEPASTEPVGWYNDNNRLAAYPWSGDAGRFQLQWGAIAPGHYTLQLQLWCDREPVASIGGVQVPAPKGGDGRLVDIDLRSLVRVATVCVFDQNGQALSGYDGVLFPVGQDPEQTWTGWDIQGAKSPILVRPGPLELLVVKRGFRPRQIQCAASTTDVKLDPWPTVELVFDAVPELPQETTLQARLAARDLREAKYRTMGNSGDRNDLMTVPRSNIKVEQGRAKVPIGDGPHDVLVAVSRRRRNTDLVMPKVEPVFSNTQSLRVEIQATALRQALDKLTALEAKK